MKTNKDKLIQLIHIQKAKIGLTDDDYRVILESTTGESSCSKLNYSQLFQVFNNLNNILKKQGKKALIFKKNTDATLQEAVVNRAEKILGPAYQTRLQGFLQKIGKNSIQDCNFQELRRVMGFLSTIERSQNE